MLGGRYATWLCKRIPWEVGWGTGVGMFSSIKPNNRILIENLQKIHQNVISLNSFQWKNTVNYFLSNAFGKKRIQQSFQLPNL
jgi:hypothetical protein